MNIDRLVMRVAVLVFTLCVVGVVMAGITSNESPTVYRILLADGTLEKGTEWPKSLDECVKRASAILPKGTCSIQRTFNNVGTCDDIQKPVLPRELDADGFVVKPPIRGKEPATGNDWTTEIQDYVPAPYPTCWVMGWREIADADLVEPDLMQANSVEPMPVPEGFDAEWHAPEAEAFRHTTHICYDDDKTPCPELTTVKTACGEEFCGVRG